MYPPSLMGGLGGGPCMITGDLGIPARSDDLVSTSRFMGASVSLAGSLRNTLLMFFMIRRGLGKSTAAPELTVTASAVTLVM